MSKHIIEYEFPQGYDPETSQIKCPPEFLHLIQDLRLIKYDGDNPNRIYKSKQKAIWKSLLKFGWVEVLVTDLAGLLSDGEHRAKICIDKGEFFGPILKLPTNDLDRRLLRQILNKLHGTHVKELDAKEYLKFVEAGRDKDLIEMIDLTKSQIDKAISLINDEDINKTEQPREVAPPKSVRCPSCGFDFDPDAHLTDIPLEIQEASGVFVGNNPLPHKKLNIVFHLELETTAPKITQNTLAVAEAFGIGLDETIKFTLFNHLAISYTDGDLIYVTGDSGGGKTTLLRLFTKHELDRGKKVLSFEDIAPAEDVSIIDGLGLDANETMRVLNTAGLGEAFLMIRKYSELSEGQRYRYRLAKLLSTPADVYIIDEFASRLDRVMARILAFNLQKWSRRTDSTVMLATTHHDLLEDLNPDLLIYKGFGEESILRYFDPAPIKFSLAREMIITKATQNDYKRLEKLHYIGSGTLIGVYKFKLMYRKSIVGIAIYTAPWVQLHLRNKKFPEYKGQVKNIIEKVNRDIIRLARVIITPKYRGAGLAVKLVKETLPLTKKKLVEVVAAMPKYNPFFEKAGMTNMGVAPLRGHQKKTIDVIKLLGGEIALLHSPQNRKVFLDNLTNSNLNMLKEVLMKNLKHLSGMGQLGENTALGYRKELRAKGLQSLLGNLLPTERVYLYWMNPEMNENDKE